MATMRISGIMSGFDTDTMIKDLMKAESARVDKVKKERQYIQWQQEGFREIISKLKTFQSNYFDVLNSTQNMRSATSFAKFSYSVKSGGVDTDKVSVIASATAASKSVTINSIDQLATKDKWTGNDAELRGIKTIDVQIDDYIDGGGNPVQGLKSILTNAGKNLEFSLSIGSNAKSISVNPADFDNIGDLELELNTKISQVFGSEYANVVKVNGSALEFDFAGSEVKAFKLGDNSESMMGLFGTETAQSSLSYSSKSIGELFGLTNTTLSSIVINGKTIGLDETDTISKMIQKVNGSEANVNLSYDSLKDRFVLESKAEGAVNNISIGDGSNAEALFSKLFNTADVVDASSAAVTPSMRQQGLNAQLVINDVAIVQSNNNFSLDGINYSLKETSATAIDIGIETNTTAIIDNHKNFVKE